MRERGEPPFRYGIIACAMRMFRPFSPYYRNLLQVLDHWPAPRCSASLAVARALGGRGARRLGLPVVGFDLAGAEAGHPASDHVEAYEFAHQHFLKKTVHAGEAYGPESIFQAITQLHADRIGHGTHLYAADQVRSRRSRPTCASSSTTSPTGASRSRSASPPTCRPCPSSRAADHPFGHMVHDRLSVALCTDNRLVSHHPSPRDPHAVATSTSTAATCATS